jgi:hypothetical protein
MKPKEFDKWTVTRKRGKKNFVLFFGALGWGVPMFVVLALFINRPESGFTVGYIVGSALVWLLGGVLFGVMLWSMNERNYLKELKNRENT